MKNYGLVLAGGGGKGAYQIGAWKALREMDISFNAIAGVSIGSINGALIAQGDYDNALTMWHSISVDKGIRISEALPDSENLFSKKNWGVLFREFIKNGGIDASPARDFISQFIDESVIRSKNIPLGVVTVQMTQGVTPLEIFLSDMPEGDLVDYLLASSNIPLATNIGPEGERFLDGGVYDNTPVMTLKKRGYNKLIVIDISNIKGVAHDLNFLNSQIVYIRPYEIDDLGPSFDFDDEIIDTRIQLGYLDTRKAFGYLSGNIYYFTPETFREMAEEFTPDTLENLEELAHELKVPKPLIYSKDEFIQAVKLAYDAQTAEEAIAENEAAESPEKDKEQDGFRFSFLKRYTNYTKRKAEDNFSEAIAVLDNYIV